MNAYLKLKTIFKQLYQLRSIEHIIGWDEAVMMPEGAGEQRAQALAAFNGLLHQILCNRKTKKLLALAKQDHLDDWDHANLQWMEKKYLSAACLPQKLTEKFTAQALACEQTWRKSRAQNNWQEFLPVFKPLFKMVTEIAKRRGDAFQLNPYDALLAEYAPGFNQATIDPVFTHLKKTIPELVNQITQKQAQDRLKIPQGPFPIEKQKQLGLKVMHAMGFNFQQGRLDISHHPFCGGNPTDVRITTRYQQEEFFSSLAGICHETGHALYEQGLPRTWLDQPVGAVNSMAMHESQSLLMESLVCCSKAFYRYLEPEIQHYFGPQEALSADNLYQLATRVKPGYIRVDSDEVTYQLHIILRYEIEKGLLNGQFTIDDLPTIWNERMQAYLGLSTADNDQNGVMQDVHWPSGAFGYFPAYTLGRLISAQLFTAFLNKHPTFYQELAQGDFHTIHQWLQKKVYAHASSLSTHDLLIKETGKPLDTNYFIAHVQKRYLAETA